MLPELSRWQST